MNLRTAVSAVLCLVTTSCGFLDTEDDSGVCTGTLGGAPVELELKAGRSSYDLDTLTNDAVLVLRYEDELGNAVDVDVARIDASFVSPLGPAPIFVGRPDWLLGWTERVLAPSDGTLEVDLLTTTDAIGGFNYVLPAGDELICSFDLSRNPPSSSGSSDWD
jgi:hypothetical protein